ncbi:uncharacterized protein EI97DRAFT_475469 [Westerdykella ornata]|uniref:Transcription regulator Rua1 C-terminal domain-containing protein n=1 Tax=Westerdykella ornata TaxID=318751 RepID=A0A6A6JKQ6_WESOR|nr:uncharacterized protein EI97DRAFT_475469 [Westerdykella ornata]KAF2275469.1 hypothetical protein EI97DRAFT_475469 [Westerdykella ornata]
MEFNAIQQYRPAPNRPFTNTRPSSRQAVQMLYPYGSIPVQQQQHHSQVIHPHPKLSPPYSTWTVPQTHNPYPHLQKFPASNSREDYEQLGARPNITVSNNHSPALSNAAFRSDVGVSESLPTTDYFPGVIDTSPWGQKVCEEFENFTSLDPDMADFNQGLLGHDENTPIIHLPHYQSGTERQETENIANFNPSSTRRLSESSFSMSSTGGALPEVSTFEELGSSEAISYGSDYEPWSSVEANSNLLSPLASPRRLQHEHVVRSGSRSRASPAPHNNVRSSPYTLETSRFKRWSTGHAPTSTPSARPLSQVQDRFAPYPPRTNPHHSMPAYPTNAFNNFGLHGQNVLYTQPHPLQSSNPAIFASPDQPFHPHLEVPRPVPSQQSYFRLLHSNVDRHGGCASHFADLSDPPDLYSSLHEEPSNPPESDMNPSDPDLVPHEQDLRFGGDLYTPRWVRGHGNKREGWCGLCKPGRWLVLKNSAFWYDKSFTHGVSAATGAAFQGPQETRRTEGNLDVWEGLCGSCGEWIALVSSKKKGTTWFRHAYKCHTHPKVKDGPKRRRETTAVRARAASSASTGTTSSPYPIKRDVSQQQFHDQSLPATYSSHSQSTPTATPTLSTAAIAPQPPQSSQPHQQYVGMPTSLPTPSQPTASFPIASPSPAMQQASTSSTATTTAQSEDKPVVVGMFSSPLQPMSTFASSSGNSNSSSSNPPLLVSEPELVGVKPTSAFNSLASMI